MDLVNHITGIRASGIFTPGPTTEAPFNVDHTGVVNNIDAAPASNNKAELYNRILLHLNSTIAASGLTLDKDNWAQFQLAVKKIVNDAVGLGLIGLSIGSNQDGGYMRFSNPNVIIQWGPFGGNYNWGGVYYFPIVFPSALLVFFPEAVWTNFASINNASFMVAGNGGGPNFYNGNYFAIGY